MNNPSNVLPTGVAALERLLLCLWVGGMVTVAFAVQLLFQHIPERALAGEIAGRLFSGINYVGLLSILVFLTAGVWRLRTALYRFWRFWVLVMMLLVILSSQWFIRPHIDRLREARNTLPQTQQPALKREFGRWHGISTLLYLVNLGCGVVLVLSVSGRPVLTHA